MLPALRHALRPALLLRPHAHLRPVLHSMGFTPLVRTVVSAWTNGLHVKKAVTELPSAKRYTEEHELLSYDDTTSIGRLHITNYASKSLGDVVFVELPNKGREVSKGEQIGAVESVKAASDIYSPVSGTVYEINDALGERPGLMSSDPESAGWLCEVKLADPSELDTLLTPEAYEKFCQGDEQG